MPFQSTDQPAMTPSSNAGARSLTFVHAFEVGERKLCAMLVWLCSKCDGVHIWMNSKVLVVGTTFSLARLSQYWQYIRIFAASIAHAPAGTPGGPCRRSQPVEAPPPRGPALELGSSEQLCPKCMYACTCCTPVPHPRYALPHVPKKKQKKRTEGKN